MAFRSPQHGYCRATPPAKLPIDFFTLGHGYQTRFLLEQQALLCTAVFASIKSKDGDIDPGVVQRLVTMTSYSYFNTLTCSMKLWLEYARDFNFCWMDPPLSKIMDFFQYLAGYKHYKGSAMITAWCALRKVFTERVQAHLMGPLIKGLTRHFDHSNPTMPRPKHLAFDMETILDCLWQFPPMGDLTCKELNMKLLMLLLICTGRHRCDIRCIRVSQIRKYPDRFDCYLMKKATKTYSYKNTSSQCVQVRIAPCQKQNSVLIDY